MDAQPTHLHEETRANALQIITYILLCFNAITVSSYFLIKYVGRKPSGYYDIALGASLLFSIAQAAVIVSPIGQRLGQAAPVKSDSDVNDGLKVQYASYILLTFCLTSSKLSIVAVIYKLTPLVNQKRFNLGIAGFIIAWGILSVFVTAFQCQVPNTWDYINGSCINIRAAKLVISSLSIVIEFILIFTPITILWRLSMQLKRRIAAVTCFALRTLVIATTAVQLFYLHDTRFNVSTTSTAWKLFLTDEVVQSVSVVATCFPVFKTFLASLESGYLRADDLSRRTKNNSTDHSSVSRRARSYIKLDRISSTTVRSQPITQHTPQLPKFSERKPVEDIESHII